MNMPENILDIKPDFIGIGAPKAGTTWIFENLRKHPDIFVTPVKETNFFHYIDMYDRIDEYKKHFSGSDRYVVKGEISVRYLASPRAAERIYKHIPDVKLFVSLRNPIDQAYSHYWHLKRQNFHQPDLSKVDISFEESINDFKELVLGSSYYYESLNQWYNYFKPEQISVIIFEDILTDPAAVIKNLYQYLGVDENFMPNSIYKHNSSVRKGRSPRGKTIQKIHTQLYRFLSINIYQPIKEIVGVRHASRLKEGLRLRTLMESLFTKEGYPEMDTNTRKYLVEIFSDDINKLQDLIQKDLSHWK